MADMALRQNQRKVSQLEVFQTFRDGYRANDAVRIEGLQSLLAIRKKKARLQERDRQRVEQRYGKNSQQLKRVESKQNGNLGFISGLGMELNRAKTRPEKVEAEDWVVKGRVYDRLGEPLANARVVLYGMNGSKVPKVSAATTDINGNYRLIFKGRAKDVEEVASDQELFRLLGGMRIKGSEKEGMGERIRTNINIRSKAGVFVRASFGKRKPVTADSIPMVARPGVSHYRDLILNFDQYEALKPTENNPVHPTRFLGNSATRELHDLENEKNGCRIRMMRFDHRINFKTIQSAQEAGYDFCAYCFGRDKSKR